MAKLMIVAVFGKLMLKFFRISLGPILLLFIISLSISSKANQLIKDYSTVTEGSLLVKTSSGHFQPMPLLDTQVTIKITGMIARATVKQFFQNQSEDYIEAIYSFPLPEDSAVDHLSMLIGERQIIGEIKEKSAAKKIYQQAKADGKKTALLEQNRANIFSSKVANIAPDEVVQVTIEYQQQVHFERGEFSLRFPSAITPRYQPATIQLREKFMTQTESGWGNQLPDTVLTPVLAADSPIANSLSIDVEIDAGIPLKVIESPYHNIVQQKKATGNYAVSLQHYQISNRDFELRWKAEESAIPRVALFVEKSNHLQQEDEYYLLMITPPENPDYQVMPREVTLVIDTSGSMEGASMGQAISALQQALSNFTSEDRFNVIAFNHQMRSLFNQPVEANRSNISRAERFVTALKAEGGTEMMPALVSALSEPTEDGFVRQIIFLTDGAVTNEDALFSVIHAKLGKGRLFTIGIGSAPNSYFMRKAAQFGRGTFTYIGKPAEVAEKMHLLFEQLENPVMQNISVHWPNEVEQFPSLIPDLYLGEPLILRVKAQQLAGEIMISGEQGQTLWQATIPLANTNKAAKAFSGIGVLWARAKIDDLLDQQIINPEQTELRQQVIDLALQHHLVSRYTSLVAVEQLVVRPVTSSLVTATVANHLPQGSSFAYPATASGWKLQFLLGCLLVLISTLFWRFNHSSMVEKRISSDDV